MCRRTALLAEPYMSCFMMDALERLDVRLVAASKWAERELALAGRRYAPSVELLHLGTRGQRVYCNSENALALVQERGTRPFRSTVAFFKDKASLRRGLAEEYPEVPFVTLTRARASRLGASPLGYPVVVKPAVGFFSVGVRVIHSHDQWVPRLRESLAELDDLRLAQEHGMGFPASVVDPSRILVERYVEGDEYAADAYYDARGLPVIVNVFRHFFSSAEDVSHNLYYSSAAIVRRLQPAFEALLSRLAEVHAVRDFPVHAEARLTAGGALVPIEVNPLRFSGWCTTDLAWYVHGVNPYSCFFLDEKPKWRSPGGSPMAFVVIYRPPSVSPQAIRAIDWDGIKAALGDVAELRVMDYQRWNVLAIAFVRGRDDRELERLSSFSAERFISCATSGGTDVAR